MEMDRPRQQKIDTVAFFWYCLATIKTSDIFCHLGVTCLNFSHFSALLKHSIVFIIIFLSSIVIRSRAVIDCQTYSVLHFFSMKNLSEM